MRARLYRPLAVPSVLSPPPLLLWELQLTRPHVWNRRGLLTVAAMLGIWQGDAGEYRADLGKGRAVRYVAATAAAAAH